MIVTSILAETVMVPNPVEFCQHKERNLLELLKTVFVGRCFNDGIVVGIRRVLSASSVQTGSFDDSDGSIDVRFEAEMQQYRTGTPVICQVAEPPPPREAGGREAATTTKEAAASQMVVLTTNHLTVLVPKLYTSEAVGSIDMTGFPPKTMLPITITARFAAPGTTSISCNGALWLPAAVTTVYTMTAAASYEILAPIVSYIDQLQADLARAAAAHPERYKTFLALIYPFDRDRTHEANKLKAVLLRDAASNMVPRLETKVLVRDPRAAWAVGASVEVHDAAPTDLAGTVRHVTSSADQALIRMMTDHIQLAELLLAMLNTYKTDEMFKSHARVWELIRLSKTAD